MDCRTALEILEVVRPDCVEPMDSELAAAAAHVEVCHRCEATFHERRAFDREIARAMRDVPVPAGLQSRLLESLEVQAEAATIVPVSREEISISSGDRSVDSGRRSEPDEISVTTEAVSECPAEKRGGWSRRAWLRAAVACAASIATATVLLFPRGEEASFSLGHLRESAPVDDARIAELPAFDGNFEVRFPDSWQAAIGKHWITLASARGVTPEGADRQTAALVPFALRLPRGREAAHGILLVIPKTAVLDPPAGTSLHAGEHLYSDPYWTVSWTEGAFVYVCFVPPNALDSLQRALESGPIT